VLVGKQSHSVTISPEGKVQKPAETEEGEAK
jgi:hypothetical protein